MKTYGIQGGIGSFNEQALMDYLKRQRIRDYRIKYLYTTEKVLKALQRGVIDYGQFAIENSVGGLVEESIKAMAKYRFKIVEEFSIQIRHFLMKLKNSQKIQRIMAHPQVLKQCKSNLKKKYKNFKLTSGKSDLIDTAKAARALAQGKIPPDIAILGPKVLSKIYDLEIIDEDLQDDKQNYTSFLMVRRY